MSVATRGSSPGDQLPQPRHRRRPARGRPPGGRRRRRALLTVSSTPRPSRPRRSPSAASRLPAGRDQPFRHEPRRPRLRRAAAPPRGAAQSGPRAPGRAAGPAGAGPRDRPAAQPARGSLLGTHHDRARYPGPDRPTKSGIDALPAQLGRTRCCAAALGDVQIDPRGAELLFQIITKRDERLDPDRDQPSVQLNGAACSATPGWSPQSLTGPPSTRTSSRPASIPVGCAPAGLGGLTQPRLECQAIAKMATIARAPARRRLAACASSTSESGRHPPWESMCAQAAMIWCRHSAHPHRTSGGGTQTRQGCRTLCSTVTSAAASARWAASLVLAFGSY